MIRRHSKTPLPRIWAEHPKAKGILGEAEIRVSEHSRIRAKLLVFRSNKAMRDFFRDVLDRPGAVCKKTQGICCPLTMIWMKYDGTEEWKCDPRYFCVVGLIKSHLTTEIIVHESVHAGFAYMARQNAKQWSKTDAMDEEEVCYPAGRIANGINQFLHSEGLYEAPATNS